MADRMVKGFAGFEIKDADKGEVEAIIATLGVVDRDGDIIRKGAIPDGAKVTMSAWGHDAVFGNRPVGKGVIHIDGNKAVFKGRIFLNTADGRETFEVLKEMGNQQEWSWGFSIVGSEIPSDDEKKQGAWRILTKTAPFEVSPVMMGAGIGTRTLGVKEAGATAQADGGGDDLATAIAEVVRTHTTKQLEQAEAKRAAAEAETKAREAEAVETDRLRVEAEAKAAADVEAARVLDAAEAERLRIEAETKAAEAITEAARLAQATAIHARFLKLVDEVAPTPAREFERFKKTMSKRSA